MTARVCVLGPSGKMGRAVISAAAGRSDLAVTSAVDRHGAPGLCEAVVPGVFSTSDLDSGLSAADVYVDFTTPDATRVVASVARGRRMHAVIGTTGLSPEAEAALAALAEVAPIVVAANFSLGVNLVLGLVRTAARVLGPDWDA